MSTLPFAIQIDTYEIDDDQEILTLSHTFYGKTLKQAVGIAHSHLLTDYFYSSSFVGEMPWKQTKLYLVNRGQIKSFPKVSSSQVSKILTELADHAEHVNSMQTNLGVPEIIQEVAN